MNKKFISMMIAMLLTVTMIVPAMAGNGDNTGEDTFGWNLNIKNDSLYGDYTLGTAKTFKAELWTGNNKITNVTREMKVTGVAEVAGLEYKDDASQWHPISEFNVAMPELLRDINREFRVTFNEVGKYTFEFNIYNSEGKVILSSKKEVNVTETAIEQYVAPETTTEETTKEETTPKETTDITETTTREVTTEETTTTEIINETTTKTVTEETTTKEVIPETTTETIIDETSTKETTEETTTEKSTTVPAADKTTSNVTTSQKPATAMTLAKTKIKKAVKRNTLGVAKISVNKIKKAQKYQIQISKSKKFTKKNILVKKTVKKVNFTIKSKKIKNKSKLYVRARAYAVVGGNKYYGKWSSKKKIKIK